MPTGLGNNYPQTPARILPIEIGRSAIEANAIGDKIGAIAAKGDLHAGFVDECPQIEMRGPIGRNGEILTGVAGKAAVVNRRGQHTLFGLSVVTYRSGAQFIIKRLRNKDFVSRWTVLFVDGNEDVVDRSIPGG